MGGIDWGAGTQENYYAVPEFSIDRGKEFEAGGIRGRDYIPAFVLCSFPFHVGTRFIASGTRTMVHAYSQKLLTEKQKIKIPSYRDLYSIMKQVLLRKNDTDKNKDKFKQI